MASPFRKIYPATGDGLVFLDGGLNSKFPVSTILDNESPDCLNVTFENGAVETRQGTTRVNTATLASLAFDALYTRSDNGGSQTMIAFIDGNVFDLQGTSFITIGSAQSVYSSGTRFGAAEYENHIFVGNGSIIPYKYNGTDWTRHGIYPTTETMTAATNSNGVLTGDYQYKLSNVNTNLVESDVGPVNATFTAASEEISVTSIPVAAQSFGVDTRRLYRTEAGGTEFRLLTIIGDNTTTSFVDNIADGSLGATAPTDNAVPAKYSVVKYHQDRLFINDPTNLNNIWYSELTNPYVFKTTNFLTIGDNSLDIVKSLEVYENGVLVFGNRSITLIYMPDTTDSNWVKVVLKSNYGCNSPYGIVKIKNDVIFPATEEGEFVGFARISGGSVQPSATLLTVQTTGSKVLTDKLQDQMMSVQRGFLGNISGYVYQERAYLTVTYGTAQTTNNRIYVIDASISNLSREQEYTWVPWTGLNATQFTQLDGNLYYADSVNTSFVYKMIDGTYNDDSAAIDSTVLTKEFPGFKGDENFNKDFRYLRMLVDKAGDFEMSVFTIKDSDKGSGDLIQVDLNPGGSLWSTMKWGSDVWGGGNNQEDMKVFLGAARGQRIQFKFTNQNVADQRFKVHWIKFAYNLKGFR